jgi:hypothetical protein
LFPNCSLVSHRMSPRNSSLIESLSKNVGFRPKILRHGWQADLGIRSRHSEKLARKQRRHLVRDCPIRKAALPWAQDVSGSNPDTPTTCLCVFNEQILKLLRQGTN